MNDTMVTFHGWVGGDVRHRIHKDVSVATIRVAVTPRIKRDGEWVDGETVWYAVTAWRSLADHASMSLKKGDAVFVHGRLRGAETWQPEQGPPSTTVNVEAVLMGHDLTRGRSIFYKDVPRRDEESPGGTPGREEDPEPGTDSSGYVAA
jgi:single-strand DNA-binding protein